MFDIMYAKQESIIIDKIPLYENTTDITDDEFNTIMQHFDKLTLRVLSIK